MMREPFSTKTFIDNKAEFVQTQTEAGAKEDIITFIADFLLHGGPENSECIRSLFRAGYCYYFAHMLKTAFLRGEVCWAAPFGHIVWVDTDGTPYDIEGLYFGEATDFVPEAYLENAVLDFKRIETLKHDTSESEIKEILEKYRAERKKAPT